METTNNKTVIRTYSDEDCKRKAKGDPNAEILFKNSYTNTETGVGFVDVNGSQHQVPEIPAMSDRVRAAIKTNSNILTTHMYSLNQAKQIVEAYFGAIFKDFYSAEIYPASNTEAPASGEMRGLPGVLQVDLSFVPGMVNTAYKAPYYALKENPAAKDPGTLKGTMNGSSANMSTFDLMNSVRKYGTAVSISAGAPPYLPTEKLLGVLPMLIRDQSKFTEEEKKLMGEKTFNMLPGTVIDRITRMAPRTTGAFAYGLSNRDAMMNSYVYHVFGIDLGVIIECFEYGKSDPSESMGHTFVCVKGYPIGGEEQVMASEINVDSLSRSYYAANTSKVEFPVNDQVSTTGWGANVRY